MLGYGEGKVYEGSVVAAACQRGQGGFAGALGLCIKLLFLSEVLEECIYHDSNKFPIENTRPGILSL